MEYCFRGSTVQLPELTITINVNERRHIPTESLIITEAFSEVLSMAVMRAPCSDACVSRTSRKLLMLPSLGNLIPSWENTSISIGRHFEHFIQKQVLSGRFASVSEIFRAGLRLLEGEEEKREALRYKW